MWVTPSLLHGPCLVGSETVADKYTDCELFQHRVGGIPGPTEVLWYTGWGPGCGVSFGNRAANLGQETTYLGRSDAFQNELR